MVQHLVEMPAIWTEAVVSTMNDVYIESSSTPEIPLTGPVDGGGPLEIAVPQETVPSEIVVPTSLELPLNAPVVTPPTFQGALHW